MAQGIGAYLMFLSDIEKEFSAIQIEPSATPILEFIICKNK
jgi:hypothetical protein